MIGAKLDRREHFCEEDVIPSINLSYSIHEWKERSDVSEEDLGSSRLCWVWFFQQQDDVTIGNDKYF
nr:hypothetical protein BaRGS_011970 [Batillaria attramentaria]